MAVPAGPGYRGRFAPSPTGPLHFGSLVAALGSYLDARAHGGEWLVRIEDIDTPRCLPGMADDILRTLERFGFEWDGDVLWQSRRQAHYAAALETLKHTGLAYGCACSRREIADSQTHLAVDGGLVYPGTCRAGVPPGRSIRAWRLRVPDEAVIVLDRVQGEQRQHLLHAVGDFVLRRADDLWAYQLAVTVDDAEQGITDIVRGADLLDSTPRQCWVQSCLGYARPRYAHLPVVTNEFGEKLSKQTRAPALNPAEDALNLRRALEFLGQSVPAAWHAAPVAELLGWARQHWSLSLVPAVRGRPL